MKSYNDEISCAVPHVGCGRHAGRRVPARAGRGGRGYGQELPHDLEEGHKRFLQHTIDKKKTQSRALFVIFSVIKNDLLHFLSS